LRQTPTNERFRNIHKGNHTAIIEISTGRFYSCIYRYIDKAAFSKKKTFYQEIGLKFEEGTNKMLHLEHGFVWC